MGAGGNSLGLAGKLELIYKSLCVNPFVKGVISGFEPGSTESRKLKLISPFLFYNFINFDMSVYVRFLSLVVYLYQISNLDEKHFIH